MDITLCKNEANLVDPNPQWVRDRNSPALPGMCLRCGHSRTPIPRQRFRQLAPPWSLVLAIRIKGRHPLFSTKRATAGKGRRWRKNQSL